MYSRTSFAFERLIEAVSSCSFSSPFPVHIGVASVLKKKKQLAKTIIADYGDPFFLSPTTPKTFYFKTLEKKILQKFDYITVPVPNAVNAHLHYKNKEKIKVIPMGYDFSKIKRASYIQNKIPVFAFAGSLDRKIQNPEVLLEHLSELNLPFKFLIYYRFAKSDILPVLKYYKEEKLSGKLIIPPPIRRFECIYELSKADFLINIDISHIAPYQSPSKIIDYALAGRPIFTFSQNFFDKEVFDQFLKGDYSKRLKVDLNNHKIENVCNKFVELYNEKND